MHTGLPTSTPVRIRHVLTAMVRRIVDQFAPQAIILFGSYARGTAMAESDIDLLIVMPVTSSRRRIANEIDRLLDDRQLPIDIVVMPPEQIARERAVPGTLAHPAMAEGSLLYGSLAT